MPATRQYIHFSHLRASLRVLAQAVVGTRYLLQRVEQRLLFSAHALPTIVALRAFVCAGVRKDKCIQRHKRLEGLRAGEKKGDDNK